MVAPKPSQGYRGPNKNLVRLKLTSQQDDTEADDAPNPDLVSPRVKEVTETHDSCAYDCGKGTLFEITLSTSGPINLY